MACRGSSWILEICVLVGFCASAQTLWQEPQPVSVSDWRWGPGGQDMAPRPPFRFVKEKTTGTNPKVEVRDAAGRTWTVKFGAEVHADTFSARLLNAVGYVALPTYFVASGSIADVHDLKRAKHFISKYGSFKSARFKLKEHHVKADDENKSWSWVNNPFVGTRELGGLKVLVMLASNWDTKDSRDGAGSNNEVIQALTGSPVWYAVTDWGASFGKSGGFFRRDRWDWNGYHAQNRNFVRLDQGGRIEWGFKGKHNHDITDGASVEDIRWLLPYLRRVSDEALSAGLTASGASEPVAQYYTRSIRDRIDQLQRVTESANIQRAGR